MGVLTAASRILGFIRDCLIAAFYGTSITAQAFVVAFRIPNTLRDLVGEGAANAAFVPVMSRVRALEGEASLRVLAQAVWSRLLILFLIFSCAGVMLAPWLVMLVAPGFRHEPDLFNLTVQLSRILLPFIGLVGLTAFLTGFLNSVHHFTSPSFGPILLNLCMIAGLFLWRPDGVGLCWGILAGGLLQVAVQWPALRRAGLRLTLHRASHPGVRQIGRLFVPRVIGTSVYQLSVLVDTIFASFGQWVGQGGIAALYFAHRFLHLPLALFGVSVAQAALPILSDQAANGDREAIRRTCVFSLRSSLFVAIPASVGLVVLGQPIISTLLKRGAFSETDTAVTAAALQWYAVGLFSLCAVKVLANALYAFHDTWTPVRSAAIALAINVGLNVSLIRPMGLSGLALATSVSSIWNSFHLYRKVRDRVGSFSPELTGWSVKVLLASLGMGGLSFSFWNVVHQGIGGLLLAIGGGVISFLLFGILLRVEEARQFVRWFLRKN